LYPPPTSTPPYLTKEGNTEEERGVRETERDRNRETERETEREDVGEGIGAH
jgi:hypothetical protein